MRRLALLMMLSGCRSESLSAPPEDAATAPTGGHFTTWSSVSPVGGQVAQLVVADLDGDGKLDVALNDFDAAPAASVVVLLGNGDGTLRAKTTWPGGAHALGIVAGDFDGDGHLDLATALQGSAGGGLPSQATILSGVGDGSFPRITAIPTSGTAENLAAADLDGDGHLDLLVSDISASSVTTFFDVGHAPRAGDITTFPFVPGRILAATWFAEPRVGIVVGALGGNQVSLTLPGLSGSALGGGPIVGSQCNALVAGDFDGDGAPDFALGCDAATIGVAVFLVPPTGGASPHFLPTLTTTSAALALAAADLDGDGVLDLAVGEESAIEIFHGRGDGTFARLETIDAEVSPTDLAAGDLDGDGRLDLVEAGTDGTSGMRSLLLLHNQP